MGKFQIVILRGCERCGLGFMAVKRSQRWCSNACRVSAYHKRRAATQRLMVETMFALAEEHNRGEQS